jgi:DNA-binding response OmpR family regulator
MSLPSSGKRVVLVVRDPDGSVLQRALETRGWSVTRIASRQARSALDSDAVLFALDNDDVDGFEPLTALSAMVNRPPVVVLSRHADARMFGRHALESLGVDCLLSWPCRVDDIVTALDVASAMPEPPRYTS